MKIQIRTSELTTVQQEQERLTYIARTILSENGIKSKIVLQTVSFKNDHPAALYIEGEE